ncbi:hypothetical protein [Ottowia sp.]|uniref:hypothetical protein n=1 Tax=Ottowia sp. TaxID=1898956 RepID=UPI0025FB3F50|nr:hypothetical protein [Ottowia sp.]MBK6616333.1 hypothetical protein [Ottowia sp.]
MLLLDMLVDALERRQKERVVPEGSVPGTLLLTAEDLREVLRPVALVAEEVMRLSEAHGGIDRAQGYLEACVSDPDTAKVDGLKAELAMCEAEYKATVARLVDGGLNMRLCGATLPRAAPGKQPRQQAAGS